MAGSQAKSRFLQKAIGYSLTGDTREQCLFMLYGTGANGKSTFLETMRAVLGDYATQADFSTFLLRKDDGPRNDIARLHGVRFVSSIEVESGRRLAEALVKQMTGQDALTARFLFAEFFEFKPQFKLFLACNHRPRIRGTDHALWRRIRLVPFTVTIPENEQDRDLPDRLREELPGILAWAVRGCLAWQREGLDAPEEVRQATVDYRAEQDIIGRFLQTCCVQGAALRASAKDLYAAFCDWCAEEGEKQSSQTDFGVSLRERGFVRTRPGGGKPTLWQGLGLIDDAREPGAKR